MMSISSASLMVKVIKPDGSEVVLDVKQKPAAQEILRVVKDEGFLVLKDAHRIEAMLAPIQDDVKHNQYMEAIIAGVEEGYLIGTDYQVYSLGVKHMSKGGSKALAKDARLIEFSCFFLAGHKELKWVVRYDRGLREETGQMDVIEAFGGDIILCNNWVQCSNPRPMIQVGATINLVVYMYRWSGAPGMEQYRDSV